MGAGLIGFASGGFFDGIVLHQILQWHHLLSRVMGAGGLERQVLWDGVFHLVMYVAGLVGVWLLWRRPVLWRRAVAQALLGFGAWHGLDAALSHWLLDLHRIRDAATQPLAWDLGWLAAFGALPAAAGAMLLRGGDGGRGARGGLTALFLAGAAGAAWPGDGAGAALVALRPGAGLVEAASLAEAVGGRVMGESGWLWAIEMPEGTEAGALYRAGALFVARGSLAGCLGWSRS